MSAARDKHCGTRSKKQKVEKNLPSMFKKIDSFNWLFKNEMDENWWEKVLQKNKLKMDI